MGYQQGLRNVPMGQIDSMLLGLGMAWESNARLLAEDGASHEAQHVYLQVLAIGCAVHDGLQLKSAFNDLGMGPA